MATTPHWFDLSVNLFISASWEWRGPFFHSLRSQNKHGFARLKSSSDAFRVFFFKEIVRSDCGSTPHSPPHHMWSRLQESCWVKKTDYCNGILSMLSVTMYRSLCDVHYVCAVPHFWTSNCTQAPPQLCICVVCLSTHTCHTWFCSTMSFMGNDWATTLDAQKMVFYRESGLRLLNKCWHSGLLLLVKPSVFHQLNVI